ncbi:hypothetical protein ACJW30_05G026500 [Castanea mollissima]
MLIVEWEWLLLLVGLQSLALLFLLKALDKYPDYKVKIVGHSLGGGTAALLTYILREQKELSSTTCVTFALGNFVDCQLGKNVFPLS